ncbi:MAG: hypothetical protein LWX07_08215, partial [Bacteroidetes bacterium]|nr:hypothetical protein [Bacteroidota bacterium]
MNCKDAKERFLEASEKRLGAAEEAGFMEHLSGCEDCAKLYEEIKAVYAQTEAYDEIEPRAFFAESVINKLEYESKEGAMAYDRLFTSYFRKLALTSAAFVLGLILFFYVTEGTMAFNFFGDEEEAASRSVTEL